MNLNPFSGRWDELKKTGHIFSCVSGQLHRRGVSYLLYVSLPVSTRLPLRQVLQWALCPISARRRGALPPGAVRRRCRGAAGGPPTPLPLGRCGQPLSLPVHLRVVGRLEKRSWRVWICSLRWHVSAFPVSRSFSVRCQDCAHAAVLDPGPVRLREPSLLGTNCWSCALGSSCAAGRPGLSCWGYELANRCSGLKWKGCLTAKLKTTKNTALIDKWEAGCHSLTQQ